MRGLGVDAAPEHGAGEELAFRAAAAEGRGLVLAAEHADALAAGDEEAVGRLQVGCRRGVEGGVDDGHRWRVDLPELVGSRGRDTGDEIGGRG